MPAEAQLWRPILDQFASAFTDTTGLPGQWQSRLAPLVSGFLAEQLTYTDPTRIPTSTVTSIEIVAAGAYEVRTRITYTADLVLLVRPRRHRHRPRLARRRLRPGWSALCGLHRVRMRHGGDGCARLAVALANGSVDDWGSI